MNLLSKSAYYIASKDGNSYQMQPLIYDTRFKSDEETTQAMAWISLPDLLPNLFSLLLQLWANQFTLTWLQLIKLGLVVQG